MHVDRTRTLRPAIPNHAPKWGKRIRASDKSSLTYAEVRWLVVQPPSQDQFEVVIASNLETLESVEFKQAEPALEYLGDDPVLVERSDYSRHDTEWTPPVQGYFSEGTAAQFRPTVEPYVDATARVKSPVESCASWFSHGVLVRAWAKKSTIARFAPGIAVSALVCSWIAHTWALVYPERPWNGIFQGSPIMSIPGQIVLPAVTAGFSLWAVLHQGGVVRYERSLRYVKFARNDIIEIVVYVGAAILLLPLARESTGIIRLNAAVYLMSTIAIRFSSRIDVAKRNRAWHVKNRPEST